MKKTQITQLLLIVGLLFTVITACDKSDGSGGDSTSAGKVKDADGNEYNTVKIGNQVWMVENLRTTKYNDGTPIPNVTDDKVWISLKTGAYCNYDNLESNGETYGRLYNWYAVNTGKLAPEGWHVPTDADWVQLTDYLGGAGIAGGKLTETGTTHWESPNTEATNETGFTALPGGYRWYYDGAFEGIGDYSGWWSATEVSTSYAWDRSVYYSEVAKDDANKVFGFSVRCVRD